MEKELLLAASYLKQGMVVAFPTETVYGLGANAFDENAINQIFSLKKRAKDNPLIVHIHDINQVLTLAQNIPPEFYLLANSFFPGPLTVVVQKHPNVPYAVTASLETVAIRMPNHPMALKLLSYAGVPIAAPSANLSGKPSPTCADHVRQDFLGKIPLILDGGNCEVGIESTVINLTSPEPTLLRPGTITKQMLEAVLGKPVLSSSKSEKILSPGMKYRHYAPNAPIFLFDTLQELYQHIQMNPGKTRTILSRVNPTLTQNFTVLSQQNLYAAFRKADENKDLEILIFCDEDVKNDPALFNRLSMASRTNASKTEV